MKLPIVESIKLKIFTYLKCLKRKNFYYCTPEYIVQSVYYYYFKENLEIIYESFYNGEKLCTMIDDQIISLSKNLPYECSCRKYTARFKYENTNLLEKLVEIEILSSHLKLWFVDDNGDKILAQKNLVQIRELIASNESGCIFLSRGIIKVEGDYNIKITLFCRGVNRSRLIYSDQYVKFCGDNYDKYSKYFKYFEIFDDFCENLENFDPMKKLKRRIDKIKSYKMVV